MSTDQVIVTNGNNTDLVINRKDKLLIRDNERDLSIYLGPATKERIEQLIFNLNQMKSVCPNVPKPKFGEPGFQFDPCPECGSRSLRCGCD